MAAVTCTPLSLKKVVKTTTKHGYSIRILVEKRKKLVNMFSNDGQKVIEVSPDPLY